MLDQQIIAKSDGLLEISLRMQSPCVIERVGQNSPQTNAVRLAPRADQFFKLMFVSRRKTDVYSQTTYEL